MDIFLVIILISQVTTKQVSNILCVPIQPCFVTLFAQLQLLQSSQKKILSKVNC